ncbi:MAG: pyridoxal-phosphate dependent enzyme [Bacteroidia bacterium]
MDAVLEAIAQACDPQLLFQSRVHRLELFDAPGCEVWVKREDESGFGISGCKKRKYASLLPYLHDCRHVGVIGGPRSNHVVALLQLLREHGLVPHLFLRQERDTRRTGNRFLLHLLAAEEEIHWIAPDDWPRVASLAAAQLPQPGYVVPEGACCAPALPGACTLWTDIARNEAEIGAPFDHIFIDAGTGLSAAALLGMMRLAGRDTRLHVVLVAGDAAGFGQQYAHTARWAADAWGIAFPPAGALHLYHPPTARAFGSVNRAVMDSVHSLARQAGLLVDPVYTAKLFLTARHVIGGGSCPGRVLIVHSGGGTGLMGFAEAM